jgi:transcription initiation factor TFIIIB Brf1 subunit/transcription initiation factor TFIIB
MKKKDKSKKKQDMPEFHFKEFTPEEDRLYVEAVGKYRAAVEAGKTLRQAYESYSMDNKELEAFIQADFLKIMIAERHFEQRQSLDDVAKALAVSPDLVKDTHKRMLQEVGVTAATQFSSEYGDAIPKAND